MHSGTKPAIFLDRDGTIIVDKSYLDDPRGVEFLPNAVAGLKAMQKAGYLLVIVSNQSGIGRGFFSAEAADRVNRHLVNRLALEGVTIDGVYYCPHSPEENCRCRKPAVGMVEQARIDLDVNCAASVVIGDKLCDWELGRAIGAYSIAIHPPGRDPGPVPDAVVDDLLEAAACLSARTKMVS